MRQAGYVYWKVSAKYSKGQQATVTLHNSTWKCTCTCATHNALQSMAPNRTSRESGD
jgi:hypothetical protein